MERVAFATVVFEPEKALLELQAASFARLAEPDDVARIIVIDNTARGWGAGTRRRLRRRYGRLSDRVEFLRPADIVPQPMKDVRGWTTQQILKLAVSRRVDAEWYVVLDAKNILVRPLDDGLLFSADGRARMGRHSYRGHPLEGRVARTLANVGIAPDYLDSFPVTHTPFIFRTSAVVQMMDAVASNANASFPDAFIQGDYLEFPLYSATLIHQHTLDTLYSHEVVQTPALWRGGIGPEGIAEFSRLAVREDVAFIALHRGALSRLAPTSARQLAATLARIGIFSSRTSARWFLGVFPARFAVAKALMKAREFTARRRS